MKKTFSLVLAFLILLSCGTAENLYEINGNKENSQIEIIQNQSYGVLPVLKGNVWQVMDGEIQVTDVKTQQVRTRLPLSALYEDIEDYLALITCGNSIQLCAVWDAGSPVCRISLFELQCDNSEISLLQTRDVTASLRFLFDEQAGWREVDMVGCAQGIYIAAMNESWEYQMYFYQLDSESPLSIGSQPFSAYNAVCPLGDDLLLIACDENANGTDYLIRISLPGGERETLRSLETSAYVQPSGYALNEEDQMLFYFMNGTGYRVSITGDTPPEPFCTIPIDAALLRYGSLDEGSYILLDEEGGLLFRNAEGKITAESFRILDLTGAETLEEAVPYFNTEFPNTLVALISGDEEERILDAVLSQSTDYDAFAVSLGSNLYQTLRNRGYLGALNNSDVLKTAVSVMPEHIRSAVTEGDQLLAFPVSVTNSTLALNVPAIMDLTGMAEEQLPTDWPGFMQMLQQLGEQGFADNNRYVLLGEDLDARTIQGTYFSWIMEDLMLWLAQDSSRINELQTVLLPVLKAFEQVPWEAFGQEGDQSWASEEEAETLMIQAEPEIAVMALDPGMAYWPLSMTPDSSRLTGQVVDALILNPYSTRAEAVIRYAETVWKHMDITIRMELDTTLNEPVLNQAFDEDLAFFDEQIRLFEDALAQEDSEQGKAELQENYSELKKFVESYRENAGWLVSESSIDFYRALEPMQTLQADEFWSEGAEDAAVFQFLDGMLPASAFVDQLASAMKMSVMERE